MPIRVDAYTNTGMAGGWLIGAAHLRDALESGQPLELNRVTWQAIDYADGLARPNLVINVYDSNGNLVLSSRDSNIADDRPNPLAVPGSLRVTFDMSGMTRRASPPAHVRPTEGLGAR